MFARLKAKAPDLDALERAEALVRARYHLSAETLVLVNEEPGRLPGQPAAMTTILFWKGDTRHRLRLFKRVADVVVDDLPPGWVAGALRDEGDPDCC